MIAIVTADGNNSSPVSKTTLASAKRGGNTVIVNVNQDSGNTGKAIKSLEATLEKKFQQLIRAVNATFRGNVEPGKMELLSMIIY